MPFFSKSNPYRTFIQLNANNANFPNLLMGQTKRAKKKLVRLVKDAEMNVFVQLSIDWNN